MSKMLDAFIAFERETAHKLDAHSIVGVPLGTRLQRIVRHRNGWQLWTATRDYTYGTFYVLGDSGVVKTITSRRDEGDEVINARPSDDTIRRQS